MRGNLGGVSAAPRAPQGGKEADVRVWSSRKMPGWMCNCGVSAGVWHQTRRQHQSQKVNVDLEEAPELWPGARVCVSSGLKITARDIEDT